MRPELMIPYFSQPKLHLGGPLTIHAFGVLVVIGIFLGVHILRRRAERDRLDAELGIRMVTWVLIGGFIGAHLVDRLVYFPADTLQDPLSLLKIWEGLSSFGGFLGAIVGAWLFIRVEQLGHRTWRYLDIISYAFPFGWVFGRTGCFVAFDHPGAETTFFLSQTYRDGVVRHNLGLDEALYTVLIILLFVALGRRKRWAGFFTGMLPLVYAPVRFLLDYLRMVDVRYGGLTPGQWGSIGLACVGIAILYATRQRAIAAGAGGETVEEDADADEDEDEDDETSAEAAARPTRSQAKARRKRR